MKSIYCKDFYPHKFIFGNVYENEAYFSRNAYISQGFVDE
jgi:hypothetical protein